MLTFTIWKLIWGLVGAFGTAWWHQETGRDPRMGGLIGLAVGFLFGPIALVSFWIWLYYTRSSGRIITKYRRWYEWWKP